MKIIPILILICLCGIITAKAKFKIPKTIIKKLSRKAFKQFPSSLASGLVASTLLDSVKQSTHGDAWSLNYFDQKFEMIASTFEMMQHNIGQNSEAIALTQQGIQTKRVNDIIMKTVLFISTAAAIGAIIWLGLKTRNNAYFKRMQSLISSLAGLKKELKARANILKTSEEIARVQQRGQELNENISLVHQSAAGNIMEDI